MCIPHLPVSVQTPYGNGERREGHVVDRDDEPPIPPMFNGGMFDFIVSIFFQTSLKHMISMIFQTSLKYLISIISLICQLSSV